MSSPCLVEKNVSWKNFGDEPVLLKKWCEVPVVVGKKRLEGAKFLITQGVEVILLDDGMQHRKLYRDLDIVLLKGEDLIGDLIPVGRLRELPKRLKKVDLIVVNGQMTEDQLIKLRLLTDAPCLYVKRRVKEVLSLEGEVVSLKGANVGVFAGVADFASFLLSVEELGPKIKEQIELGDHQALKEEQLEKIKKSLSAGLSYWVCSEKDEVKLTHISHFLREKIVVVRSELLIEKNEDALKDLIKKRLEVA